MYRFGLTFILYLFSILSLCGKNSHYSYTQLSIGEGLSQANIECMLMDRRGDLWIGTKNGLNRYSQQQMENFFHQMGNIHSLPHSRVLHLAEDSLGNIWAGTINGLAQYDREQRNFSTLTRGHVNSSLCIEGGILFGGDNVLYFYNYLTEELERIHIHPEGPQTIPIEYRVQKIIPFKKNKVLLGTRKKGLFTYDCHTRKVESFTNDFPNYLLFSLCAASDQYIYASFYGHGVYRFDQSGKMAGFYMSDNSPLNNNYVMDILEHRGKLWLATDGGGINLIDLNSGDFSFLSHVTGNKSSLPSNSITTLYKDYHGNLWAGSVFAGVFNIKDSYIKTYQDVVMNNANGLTDKAVACIYEETDGTLWIGTDGGGINHYNPKTDQFTHYPSTYGDKVVSIAGISNDELLVSLYTKGIFTFNKKTAQYTPFIVVDRDTNQRECFYGYLPLANQVNDDKIYIISFGAWIYHINERKFSPLVLPQTSKGNSSALKLAYANLDFSLLQQGQTAYMVNAQTDSVSLLLEVNTNEYITSMTYDAPNRTVWIGTNHGIAYYHLDEKEYTYVPTKLFNSTSFLTIDQTGRLWICAENKLFSYHIQEKKFTSWNQSDGYLPNEIQSSFQKTHNKDFIYLCGTQGLVRIANSIQPAQTEHPDIYLADIQYNGKSAIKTSENNRFKIPWDYHSLVFTFGVKSEDVFQKYLMKYTLESSSGQHVFESHDPQFNLSSLSPDNYTLRISCYNKDGSESQSSLSLTLIVSPPWYQSTWFITLIVLLSIGMTAVVARWIHQKKTLRMKGDMGEFLQNVLQTLDEPEHTENRSPKPVLNEADQTFLDKMDKLIQDNLSDDNLSAKFLTDHLAMSRASLYNKVKMLTGMGVNDYINRIRIERSVHLLTTTDMSINEISFEVGFSYPRYFSTSFKQMKGMTPTRFKEENKKKMSVQ